MTPLRDDYLMRQAQAIAAILARVIGLRLEGDLEHARAGLEEAYSMLLGSQSGLIRRVDSATVVKLIGSSEKSLAFASLLEEEAEQEPDEGRKERLRARAAELKTLVESKEPR
jgi:hypothetical protein